MIAEQSSYQPSPRQDPSASHNLVRPCRTEVVTQPRQERLAD